MNYLLTPQTLQTYLIYGLFSMSAFILAIFIPGYILLSRFKLRFLTRLSFAYCIGLCLWAWQGYIFGYLHIRFMSYAYIGLFFFWWLKNITQKKLQIPRIVYFTKTYKIALLLIVIGFSIQILQVLFAMNPIANGLLLCGGDSNDNIWFASVANELRMKFPPDNPGMSGIKLVNYHYWSNFVVSELSRVFGLPLYFLQFQFSGILLSLFLGLSILAVSNVIGLPYYLTCFLLFFIYFGADAHIIIASIATRQFNFNLSSLEDGTRLLSNLPRAYAVVIYFNLIGLLLYFRKNNTISIPVIFTLSLIGSSLVGFKIYVAIFYFIGIGSVAIYDLLHKRFTTLFLLFLTGIFTLLIYVPVNANAGTFFFVGLWRSRDYIVTSGLHLAHLELARTIFMEHKNYKYLLFDLLFITLYILGTFGTKIIGLFQTKNSLRIFPVDLHILLIPALCINFILGMFFMQSVGSSNTFNFLVNVFIIGSLYAALSMYHIYHSQKIQLSLVAITLLLVFTVPRIGIEIANRIQSLLNNSCNKIQNEIIDGAKYIVTNTDPFDEILIYPRGFPFDETSPLFQILTDRPMYFSGEGLLHHFHMDTFERKRNIEFIFQTKSKTGIKKLLKNENIRYLIMVPDINPASTESAEFLKTVYKNPAIQIKQFQPDNNSL